MTTSTSFAQMANNQSISLSSALRANTPPTKGQTTSRKFLTLSIFFLLSFFTTNLWGATQTYSYTFTAKQFSANGSKTLNSVSWTLAGNGNYWGYDGTKGQQFGSGSAPCKTLTLSTSGISGTITEIIINTSGASSVNASFTVSVGGTQWGSSTKLTTSATAYTFTGSNSGEIKFSYTQTSSKALYIKSISVTYETAASYTVTYNANGGSGTMTQSTGSSITLKECAFTAPYGKEFKEWNATASGNGTSYQPGDIVTESLNLYAIWQELPKYTVKFYKTSTTFESDTEASAGEGVTPPTMEKECGEWTFMGWSESSSNSENSTTPLSVVTLTNEKYYPTKDIDLYPVYTKSEGGGGSPEEILLQTLQYDNWSYSGSTTDKSDYRLFHSSSYIESAEFDLSTLSKVIVYGGTFGGDSYNKLTIAGVVGAKSTIWKSVTVSGKSQTGVNTYTEGNSLSGIGKLRVTSNSGSSSNTGVRISKILIYTLQATSTTYYYSYPQCATETSVTLNPNGGTFASNPEGWTQDGNNYKKEGVTGAITLPTPTKTGYNFDGWYDGETKVNSPYTPSKTVTLVAKWTAKTYTVTLDNQEATTAGATSVTATYNAAMPSVASNLPKKTGYTFNGYFDAASGGTQYYKADGTSAKNWDKTAATTLYAQWTLIEYTLSLESTLNCVTNGSVRFAYNATSAKTFTPATRDDYTCTGYWSAPSGGVQVLNADGSFTGNDVNDFITDGKWLNTTATKLTPHWETEYKMILSKGTEENGTYTLSPTTIETSSCATLTTRQVTITATPNTGYEVDQITYSGAGTATKKSGPTLGAGKTTWVYTFAENDKGTGTFTVTFKSLPQYTVTFSTGTGNPTQAAIKETTGGAGITLPAGPTPTCPDWTFAGWTTESVSETTTEPTLIPAGNYKPTEDCTLYAVYSKTETTQGGGMEVATLTTSEISGAYIKNTTTQYGNYTINSQSGTWGGLIYIGENYIQISANDANRHLESPTFSGNISNITITGRHNASKTRNIYICSSNTTAKPTNGDIGSGSINSSGVENEYTDWKDVSISVSGDNKKFYVYADGGLQIQSIVVTYSGGSSSTTYNSNPTCLVPVWDGATIDKTSFTVNCGERSPMTGANGAAKITFPTDKIYNFTSAITIEATSGFLVSTNQSVDANYKSSVSLRPLVGTTNANTFDDNVYVRAEAPAQSDTDLEGTITIKNSKGETLQTFSVTAVVTCTKYTLTLVDRGVSTEQATTYYADEAIDEAPADPEGVCTDPIHYVFDGWAAATVAEGSTTYTKVTFPYTVTGNTKFYAVYRYLTSGGDGDYHLVEKALDDWSGDYLIAYDNETFADGTVGGENGIGEAGKKVNLSSCINNNTISATEGDKYNVTLEAVTGGYVLKTQDGNYNYHTNNTGNGISASTISFAQKYPINVNFVSQEEVNLCLTGDALGSVFRYNDNSSGYFRFYKNGGMQPVYLYKKSTGTTLYTTSPVCGPHLAITDGKDIYVTGGNAGGTRDLVIAQQKVSYKATRLNVGPTSQVPDVKVATNGITVGGVVTTDVKVTIDQTKEQQTDGTYTITGTITVQYQPSANGKQEDIQVQLAVDYNAEARDNFTVHARSLPSEFVIVAKSGDKWYALNGDMNNGSSANPANGQVTLDDDANPTKATYAPCNTIYTFDGVPNTGDRTRVRFQGTDGAWLWAASGTNVGIQNKSLKDTPEGNNNAYNWKLETEDNITYKFHNDNNSRLLGLNGEKFGMYASGVQDIRILPYEAKCLYNYAPTNLKVSVLKGSYVTLTWDAVAGATKYQYSTDGTTWIDAGTEPTVTISGLSKGTDYTYYVRAYHEDDGVSQECIDYAVITFTTADCDDVPTNITYTADLNSITVSWTAAAPTATIKLFMNEDGTGGGGTYPGAISPKKISGGLKKNTTYYIQILADGTCASPIVPVKTEDVEVDIVEWYPQGIIVDINTDETVGITLENEVSYGSGLGTEATELFFSKYYEASYNVKLVAIYNGTKNIIDLTDYIIKYGKTSWETNYITLKDFGATKGQIQPGEEIILYSYTENNADDKKILDCVHEKFPDGDWVRVTSSNNTGKGILSFAGDKTLALFKGKNIIDIIGAVNGSIPNNSKANAKPFWGDANGWNCATGLSLADDSEIGISTNRCLLVRNNTVTSGANAVASNTTDFVTLCSEWKGAHVLDSDVDNGINESCENFAYVGNFDYSDYYTKYETMGDERVFDENARNADGTVTIPITDLYKHACSNIRVKLTNSKGELLTDREYKVPIMITTTQGTDGQAFLDLQQNLATKEVDGEGNVIKTYPLSLNDVREICKTCDVVVRDNATLTKIADDAANDHPQVRNIYVYENSSLIVPNGTHYTINNLSLRRKQDAVASVSAYPTALKLPESAAAPISLDFRLSAESWHWFTLPYECNINEVTWADGTPAQYNTDWYLMTYDGEKRAETQAGGCWKAYTGTTINAGDGFIIAINGNINNPAHTYELHFPMSKEVLAAEETDKTVAVRAWGVETNIRPNHKGWNLVGNPYLDYYQRNNITNFEGLRLGQLTGPDPQTGYWEQTGDVPYVVVPIGAGYEAYEQLLASETDLLPFTAYFVQVGNDGKHASSDKLSISFDHSKLQLSATPMPASIVHHAPSEVNETEEPVIVGVVLTNSLGESDKTSLVIADRFTNEYEMQADFFKWFGDYYKYYTKPVLYTIGADQGKRAFNALNEQLATQPIPMGLFAAKAGDYTFALNRRSDLSKVEEVWLHDANTNTYTNLMQNDYNFYTTKTDGGGRFTISVKLAPKVATSIDNVTADKVWATTHTKQVIVNGLENGMHLWLYDATGKLLYNEPTSNYQHTYAVPQTGTYFVSVMNGNQKQTIKVVVE